MMKGLFFLLIFPVTFALNGQVNISNFFDRTDVFLAENVSKGLVDYVSVFQGTEIKGLISFIESEDANLFNKGDQKAFLINAYNLLVIHKVVQLLPTNSVQNGGGFFEKDKITVGGETYTLNSFEKERLLEVYKDPRLHFVLVCGAIGCPPIIKSAYRPGMLEDQLNEQTRIALSDKDFIKVSNSDVQISQIFKWYASDFGSSKKAILSYINKFRQDPIDLELSLDYYSYDWTLNMQKLSLTNENDLLVNNSVRYVVSSTIPKGNTETKIFNNLYSQRSGSNDQLEDRSTFFTTLTSFLYGVNNRFNLGFAARYRRVRNEKLPSSPFEVLGSGESGMFRQGITAFGPQIRYAPIPKWENFSVQSNFVFPLGKDLSGSDTQPYIDWGSVSWTTQFFNDRALGNYFSLFTEVDIIWEDIGLLSKGQINQFSIPATAIISYFPTPFWTIYGLAGVSPYFRIPFDYFLQAGIGTKYQFSQNFELELLYTGFTNTFLLKSGGDAQTFNLGFRFNI